MPLQSRIDLSTASLVVIDLQKGILARETQPRAATSVLANAVRLADAFRSHGGLVVCVRVSTGADGADRLAPDADQAMTGPLPPAGWDEVAPELQPGGENTIVVTKRNWGAFYGTDLELQLRRRGRDTIVLCGISTNIGVESTARDAAERAYRLIFVEDAMAALSAEEHAMTVTKIFPRIGRVCTTDELLANLG